MRLARTSLIVAALIAAANVPAQSRFKTLYVPHNTTFSVGAMRVSPNGALSFLGTFPADPNPYDCAVTPDGRLLVIACASALTSEPVYTYRVNPDGTLTLANGPTYIGDGTLSIAMGPNSALITEATQDDVVAMAPTNNGSFPINAAPAGPFPVEVAISRDGTLAFVSGTSGGPYLYSYRLNPNGSVTPLQSPAVTGPAGTGQGLATHPLRDVVYQSTGLGNVVVAYSYNSTGAVTAIGSASNGGNSCVEMAVHPSGKWLYVCNVVSDTLTVMPLDPNGVPSNADQSFVIGNDIRDVVCDDRFVYVTDESSLGGLGPGVQVFSVAANGALSPIGTPVFTGATRPSHMALWVPPPSTSNPVLFDVVQGTLFGGGIGSLSGSDDEKLYILNDETMPNAEVHFTLETPILEPVSIDLTLETSANRYDIGQFIDVFDRSTFTWANFDFRLASPIDTVIDFSISSSAGNYFGGVDPRPLAVRVRWIPTQDLEAADGWSETVDWVRMVVKA